MIQGFGVLGLRFWDLGFRVLGFGFWGFRFRVLGSGGLVLASEGRLFEYLDSQSIMGGSDKMQDPLNRPRYGSFPK